MTMAIEEARPAVERRPTMPLSVVLPNYNHAVLLPRALRALLEQTPAAQEIIIIDDGSTDDSVQVIERFQRRFDSIKLIRNDANRGVMASVRTALEAATGEFVLLAASDDFVLPGLFARAQAALSAYPQAAIFCSAVAMLNVRNEVIGVRPFCSPRRTPGYLSPAEVRRAIRRTDFWFLGTSCVYRRALLEEIGYFDQRLGTLCDVLADRLLAFRHGFYFDPAVLAAYYKDPDTFSGRTALSVTNTQRQLDAAAAWIADNLPVDVRDEHGPLFDRRMRFGMARLWVIWRNGRLDTDAIADILKFTGFDRAAIAVLARVPLLSSVLVLGWMTIRMRPFGLFGLSKALLGNIEFVLFRRPAVQRAVATVLRRA